MRLFKDNLFYSEIEKTGFKLTLSHLLTAAFAHPHFATALINFQSTARYALSSLKLDYDNADDAVSEIEHTEVELEDDFFDHNLALLALERHAKLFKGDLDAAIAKSEWVDMDVFLTILESVISIAHVENVIQLVNKNPDEEIAKLSAQSIEEVTQYALLIALTSFGKAADAKAKGKVEISKEAFLVNMENSIGGISASIRVFNETTFRLYTELNSMLTKLVANVMAMKGETKVVALQVCDDIKYNTAYAHLNDNEKIGEVELPVEVFSILPFPNYMGDDSLDQTIITKVNPPENVSMERMLQGINYSFDSSCTCEHDCCGCSSSSFRATVIQGNYIAINRYESRNV